MDNLLKKYPSHVPVMLTFGESMKKFLVPRELTFQEFMYNARCRMNKTISSNEAIFVHVNSNILPVMTATMEELYLQYVDEQDGILQLHGCVEKTYG
jgi:hypothetical protein